MIIKSRPAIFKRIRQIH